LDKNTAPPRTPYPIKDKTDEKKSAGRGKEIIPLHDIIDWRGLR